MSSQKDKDNDDYKITLSQLVQSFFPSETSSERQRAFFESYCHTLVGSSLRPNSNFTKNPLLQSNNQDIKRNAENLYKCKQLKHPESILYVLHELSKQNKQNNSYLPSSIRLPTLKTRKHEHKNINQEESIVKEEKEIESEGEEEEEIAEKESITEPFIIQCCINSILGIESKLISWQRTDMLKQDPFAEKPIFCVENQDSDEEVDLYQQKELEERVKQQQIDSDILDRHCALKKTQTEGFRVTATFRYGISALPSSQLEIVEKICYTGTLYSNISKQISKQLSSQKAGIILQSVLTLVKDWFALDYYQCIANLDPLSISLRALYVWTMPFTRRFEQVALALSELSRTHSEGGQILSTLFRLSNHGNPTGKSVKDFQ